MKTITYKTATVRLRRSADPSEPELRCEIVEGCGRNLASVKVTTRHPIWHGAVLSKNHFRVVGVDDT